MNKNIGKLIGVGNTAEIFEWQKNKVIKIFKDNYPVEAIEKEFTNAKAIEDYSFSKPKVYDMVKYNNRYAIIYEKISGMSLLSWVIQTYDIENCAKHMANLHKKILNCNVNTENIISYKDFLYSFIKQMKNQSKDTFDMLDKLPDGNTLCHGDFHPGNIFINGENETVIDFMNICKGHYLYDIARTVYLVEYTPDSGYSENIEMIKNFKKELAKAYLQEMNIKRKEIKDFIEVIQFARMIECPNENTKS